MVSLVQDNQTGGLANAVADKRVELKYNALGQFTSIERNQNTSATYPSLRTAFTYDAGNRLSSIAHRNYTDASTSTLLSDYAFTHDNISRITAINSSLVGISIRMAAARNPPPTFSTPATTGSLQRMSSTSEHRVCGGG